MSPRLVEVCREMASTKSAKRDAKPLPKSSRVLFFGSTRFAVPAFEALIESPHEVVGLVAEPDRVQGEGPDIPAGAWRIPILEVDAHILEIFQGVTAEYVVT